MENILEKNKHAHKGIKKSPQENNFCLQTLSSNKKCISDLNSTSLFVFLKYFRIALWTKLFNQ